MVGLLALLLVWLLYSFAYRRHEAGVVRSEHFDNRIAFPQLLNAVGNGETPGLLVPRNLESGIAIPIIGNIDFCFHAGHRLNKFGDAIHSCVPLAVEFL